MTTLLDKDRETTAQDLRKQIQSAKDAGNSELAAEAILEIRKHRLWRELGFTSFNDYAKSKDCPYSSNYAYKMSVTPTDPLLAPVVITDKDLAAPDDMADMVLSTDSATVKDLRGNELHGDLAELFQNAQLNFGLIDDSIRVIRIALRNLAGERSGARFSVHNRSAVLMQHLHDIEGIVNDSRPYSICISCSGNRRQCIACGGVGFINEQQYIDATTTKRRRG